MKISFQHDQVPRACSQYGSITGNKQEELGVSAQLQKYVLFELPVILVDEITH